VAAAAEGTLDKSFVAKLPSASSIVPWLRRSKVELALVAGTVVLAVLAFGWKGYDFANFSKVVIGDQGDTLTFTSLVYQAIDNLVHRPTDLGYALIYYGDPSPFAYTVAPYGVAVAVLPLYLLTGFNLELTMNIYILLTFALTALAVYLLVRYLLDVTIPVAAFAGLMVAFAQFRFLHVAHVETLSTQFYILALYLLHRFLDAPIRKWAIWLAVGFWFTFFTSGYMGYMFLVATAIVLLFLFFWQQLPLDRESLRAAAIFVLTTVLISLPFLAMRSEKGGALSGYSVQTIEHYAANPIDWTSGNSFLYFSLTNFANEKTLFLGFTPIALALAGWLLRRRGAAALDPSPAVATTAGTPGGARPSRRLSPYQVLVVYGTMIVVGYLLTLGPKIAFSETFEIPSPYMLLLQIPGFSSLRVPARFILLAIVGSAVLGAWALAEVGRHLDRVRLVAFYSLAAVFASLELIPYDGTSSEERRPNSFVVLSPMGSTIPPMATEQPQSPAALHAWLRSQPPGTAVYNFPATPEANRRYMYFLRFHGQPMLNGQSSFMPQWFTQVNVDSFPKHGVIRILRERKIKYALVHNRFLTVDKRAEIASQARAYMDAGWLKLVGRFDDVDVYEVQAVQPLRSIRLEFDGPIEGSGWHKAETREGGRSFAWTAADTATLDLLLQADRDLDVVFTTNAGVVQTLPDSLRLAVNGQPVPLRKTREEGNFRFAGVIPQGLVDPSQGLVHLEFKTAPPVSPASLGRGSKDKRELGLAFDWLELKPHSSLVSLEFDKPAPGTGWYPPETDASRASVAWTSAASATLTLPVSDAGDLALIARLKGADKETLASLVITANGSEVRFASSDDGDATVVRALIPAAVVGEAASDVALGFKVDRLGSTAAPGGRARRVGVAFDWLYLYAANSVRLEFDAFPVGVGWYPTESDAFGMTYRWMAATRSSMVLPLPADRSSAIEFRVLRAPTPEILNSLSLSVNGERIGLTYDNTTGDHLFRGVIPAAVTKLADPAQATLTFQVESVSSLKAVGEGNDTRGVGCAFDWLELRPVPDAPQ
jgi:hypothetical protein